MPIPHSDRLTQFSYLLAKIEFILFEIVIFLGFLLWLGGKVKHDYLNFESTPMVEPSPPRNGKSRPLPLAQPSKPLPKQHQKQKDKDGARWRTRYKNTSTVLPLHTENRLSSKDHLSGDLTRPFGLK